MPKTIAPESKDDVLKNKTKPKYAKVDQSEIFLYRPVLAKDDAVRVAMVYPAAYQIAMSSLGYLTLFQSLDENPNIAVKYDVMTIPRILFFKGGDTPVHQEVGVISPEELGKLIAKFQG